VFVPSAELTVEVVARVTFAALVDASRPVRLHGGVDHLGHALVGRRPIVVAAAKDGVSNVLQRILTEGVVDEPVEKAGRVVRGGAVVGGSCYDHSPFLGQLVNIVVQGSDRGRKAVGPRVAGDLMGYLFGRAQVGAVQAQEWRVALYDSGGRLDVGLLLLLSDSRRTSRSRAR
jgi:hypothetical protein